jgi:hypothetical protein
VRAKAVAMEKMSDVTALRATLPWLGAHLDETRRLGIPRCRECGERFVARADALTCSEACLQAAYRKRRQKRQRRVTDK